MRPPGLRWLLPAAIAGLGILAGSAMIRAELDLTADRRNSLASLTTELLASSPEVTAEFFRNSDVVRRSAGLSALEARLQRLQREAGVLVRTRNTAEQQVSREAERIGLTGLPADWFGPAALAPEGSQYAGLRLSEGSYSRVVPLLPGPAALEYEVARFAWEASRPNHRIGIRIMSDQAESGRFDDGLAVLAGRAELGALPAGELVPDVDLALVIALRDPDRDELALLQQLTTRGTPVILLVDPVRLEPGGFGATSVPMPRMSAWLGGMGVELAQGVLSDDTGAPIPLSEDPDSQDLVRRPRYSYWLRPDPADFGSAIAPAVATADFYWSGMLRAPESARILLSTPADSRLVELPRNLDPGSTPDPAMPPPDNGAVLLALPEIPLVVGADSDWIGPLTRLSGADSNAALLASLVDYALGLEDLVALRFRDAPSPMSGLIPFGRRILGVLVAALVGLVPGLFASRVGRGSPRTGIL